MMILMEKAQATILITQNVGNNAKMGRKLTFSYRFSNFGDWPRVSAVHISTKYSSDIPEDGKNTRNMRFDAITGLKTSFWSEVKVSSLLPRPALSPLSGLTDSQTREF